MEGCLGDEQRGLRDLARRRLWRVRGTTEAQTYRFVAEDLAPGTHTFRLQQKDLDGATFLSDAMTVQVRPEGSNAIRNVAPNPVRNSSTLSLTLRESSEVIVGLYNVLGQEVRTLRQGRATAGQHQVTLNASGLSSGMYFLRVPGDGFTRTKRTTVAQ